MTLEPQTLVYKRAQGVEIRADVYRLPGAPRPAPVLLWLHGGALIAGSRGGIRPEHLARYLEAGFAVVAADYRLAPQTKLDQIVADVNDTLRWVRQEGPDLFDADPARVAVVGHSAGGYLAMMSGTFRPPPQGVVAFYGYGDIVAEWYTQPSPFYLQQPLVSRAEALAAVGDRPLSEGVPGRQPFYLYCRQQGRWPLEVSGHDPATEPDFFEPFCPARRVTASYPPTLLLHGTADTDVPYGQSVQMEEALAEAGVEGRLITIPGGGHGFDGDAEDPAAEEAFEAVVEFLGRQT